MRNQFFFTRKEKKQVQDPLSSTITEEEVKFIDSFNLNKVIRAVSLEDGRMIILLDDIHERIERVPVMSNKGKMINTRIEKGTYQSEVFLDEEDAQRFIKLTSILE